MHHLQMNHIGLEELNEIELVKTEGGFWGALAGAVAAAVGAQILSDWDDFKAGLSGNCPK